MGVYAYCVVPAGHAPRSGLTGLAGSPIQLLDGAGLGVWVSRLERPEPELKLVQVHNDVVEAAVTEAVTPVPLRFGQWLEKEDTLLAGMTEKAAVYREKLALFAGCLEFGLRLIDPAVEAGARDVQAAAPASGLEYMQSLAANNRRAEQRRSDAAAVRARVHESLGDLIRVEQEEQAATPHAVVTLSHLVARLHFDEYRERARALRQVFPELRLLLSGPWPPYSFAA